MVFRKTTAVDKILLMDKRLKIIQGGSSAGKTIAILLILIDLAQSSPNRRLISVVSETIPHLKRGAIRDFLNIMEGHKYYKEANWNRTDFIYTFETGTKIEFFSADNADKVRGPRRDILFLNEANNIEYETYTQLAIRTNEDIYIDYNPVGEFWVHTEIVPNTNHNFTILTYKDNEGLPQTIVDELESRQHNKRWWTVYGLGQLGEIETRVYKGWKVDVDDVPMEARLERYGIDFGYSNDPTAIVAVYYYNGVYILDEVMYQKGLLNSVIAQTLNNQEEKALVIADSAEPKSIDEIRLNGVTILPAQKGAGSINRGIDYVQQQKIWVTKRSVNIIKEYRNYLWTTDKDGKVINEPMDINNHAMDAIRYAIASIKNPNQSSAHVHYAQSAQPLHVQAVPNAPQLQQKPKFAHVHVPRL